MHEVTLRVVLSEGPGGVTRFCLEGDLEPVPCASEARRLFALLTRWTRAPISVALCVDGTSQAWSEAWIDALAGVDVGDLEVRFTAADGAGTPPCV